MKIKFLTGTNKIGGCVVEISTSQARIIIDYGENLDGSAQIPIKGLTDSDLSKPPKYNAVFITHSHGDHIGNVSQIRPDIPVYMEEKAMIINDIICDFTHKFKNKVRAYKNPNIKTFTFEEPIMIKDIKVTPYLVDHSSYNSAMFLIEAEGKRVLHTGDYRAHGKKGVLFIPTLKKIGPVDFLITEGTTLTRNNKIFNKETNLIQDLMPLTRYDQIYFMCSSSNIDRIVTMYKSFKKTHLFLNDLCMNSVAKELPNIPNSNTFKDVTTFITNRQKKDPYLYYLHSTKKVIEELPFSQKFALSTKTSMRDYLASHQDQIQNACLVYSMYNGYRRSDWPDKSTYEFVKFLTEDLHLDFYEYHTSGHGDIKAMENLFRYTKPKEVRIIHTENQEQALAVAKKIYHDKVKLVHDGDIVKL